MIIFANTYKIKTKTEFSVTSDIDDTILNTGKVSKLKWGLLINTFFKSRAKRKA
ncbi:MAG: phosphatidate phosphatase APP1 [Polaribacter sp.]|jgi:phosphatidate phosphatase APP1